MRRTLLLLTTMSVALLTASGVAVALNAIQCETIRITNTGSTGETCYGTSKPDLMKGTDGRNDMVGKAGDDVLKGFGGRDILLGGRGNDRLLAGPGIDSLYTDEGDDTLNGGEGADGYRFGPPWGKDRIVDTATSDKEGPYGNTISIERTYDSGSLTINLNSDSGSVPEMTNGTDTVDWSGNVIKGVLNEALSTDDRIIGNDDANIITSLGYYQIGSLPGGPIPPPDSDTVSAGGGDDTIDVADVDSNDTVDCGEGNDTVRFTPGDTLINCEIENPNA